MQRKGLIGEIIVHFDNTIVHFDNICRVPVRHDTKKAR